MVASLTQTKRWKTHTHAHTHTCTIPNQRFVTDSSAFSPSFTLNIFRFHARKEFSQTLLTVGAQRPGGDGREGQEENVERATHTQRSLSRPGPGPGPAELSHAGVFTCVPANTSCCISFPSWLLIDTITSSPHTPPLSLISG